MTGTVSLGGATLDITLINSFDPALGNTFTIINNDGTADAVSGNFAGLTQGATLTDGNKAFRISYTGGDGNDVVLTAVDFPPTITAIPVLTSIAENASTASAIKFANLSIVDPDGNNTLSLIGADAGLFELRNDGIYLRAGAVLDFETNPALDVTLRVVTLDHGTISAPASFNVTDVNEAPTAVAFSNARASIAENASTAARTKVADIVITDDALGSETITLTGADAALFEVFGGDLYLKAGTKLDFETNPKLDVTVNVNDPTVGGVVDVSRALSISVTDVNEAPTAVGFQQRPHFNRRECLDRHAHQGGRYRRYRRRARQRDDHAYRCGCGAVRGLWRRSLPQGGRKT